MTSLVFYAAIEYLGGGRNVLFLHSVERVFGKFFVDGEKDWNHRTLVVEVEIVCGERVWKVYI